MKSIRGTRTTKHSNKPLFKQYSPPLRRWSAMPHGSSRNSHGFHQVTKSASEHFEPDDRRIDESHLQAVPLAPITRISSAVECVQSGDLAEGR